MVALLWVVFSCAFVTFPYGVPRRVFDSGYLLIFSHFISIKVATLIPTITIYVGRKYASFLLSAVYCSSSDDLHIILFQGLKYDFFLFSHTNN